MTFRDMYMPEGYQLCVIVSGSQVVQLDLFGKIESI